MRSPTYILVIPNEVRDLQFIGQRHTADPSLRSG